MQAPPPRAYSPGLAASPLHTCLRVRSPPKVNPPNVTLTSQVWSQICMPLTHLFFSRHVLTARAHGCMAHSCTARAHGFTPARLKAAHGSYSRPHGCGCSRLHDSRPTAARGPRLHVAHGCARPTAHGSRLWRAHGRTAHACTDHGRTARAARLVLHAARLTLHPARSLVWCGTLAA